jgi:hypothetical protein
MSLVQDIINNEKTNINIGLKNETLDNIISFILIYNSLKNEVKKESINLIVKDEKFSFINEYYKFININSSDVDFIIDEEINIDNNIQDSLNIWNSNYIGINNLELNIPITNIEYNTEKTSDYIGIFSKNELSDLINDSVNDCGLSVKYIDKSLLNELTDTNVINDQLTNFGIQGSMNIVFHYNLNFDKEKKEITGVMIPQNNEYKMRLNYSNKTFYKDEIFKFKDSLDFKLEISFNKKGEFVFNVIPLVDKIDLLFTTFNMEENTKEFYDIMNKNIKECVYYIGEMDKYFLLSCIIIGTDKCSLIKKETDNTINFITKIIIKDEDESILKNNIIGSIESFYTI